jgi:hypothetical protein
MDLTFTKMSLKSRKVRVKQEPVEQKKNGLGGDKMSSKKTPKNKKEISFGIIKYPYAGRRVSHGKGIGPGRSA